MRVMESVVQFLHIPKKKSSREEKYPQSLDHQNQQTQENPNNIQTYEVELLKNKQYFLSILN